MTFSWMKMQTTNIEALDLLDFVYNSPFSIVENHPLRDVVKP